MGSKYKRTFEREWHGKSLSDVKLKALQVQADKNITDILKGKIKRRSR